MAEQSNEKRRLGSIKKAASKSVGSAKAAASGKAGSVRDATVQGTRMIVDSRAAQGLSSAGGSVSRRARDAASEGSELAGTAVARGGDGVKSGVGLIKEKVPWDSVVPDDARSKLLAALNSTKTLSGDAKQRMTEQVAPVLSALTGKGMVSQAQMLSILQGWLASPEHREC